MHPRFQFSLKAALSIQLSVCFQTTTLLLSICSARRVEIVFENGDLVCTIDISAVETLNAFRALVDANTADLPEGYGLFTIVSSSTTVQRYHVDADDASFTRFRMQCQDCELSRLVVLSNSSGSE